MRNEVRASDAERDSAALQLREHFVQGRLTLEELKGRLDTALTARTRGQLDGVLADLPRRKQPVPAPKPATPAVPDRYIAVTILILVMVAWLLATAWFSQRGYGYPAPPHPPYPGR